MKKHKIIGVIKGSIADELNIKEDDYLCSVNNKKITDVFDYRIETYDESILLEIESENEITTFEIEKNENEELGIIFESSLMDNVRTCANNCIFCFVDQLPNKMRKALYFKDDDVRLSFLYGNYVTLTNVGNNELDRIIEHKLSPINISVHSTDPVLRENIIGNKKSGKILSQMKKILKNNIEINAQFVIVPGVNDKEELIKSLNDLYNIGYQINSISVVPVGITKFRNKDDHVRPVSKKDAEEIIRIVDDFRMLFLDKFKKGTVYAADELYIKAESEIPKTEYYDEYPQIENGVGLIRVFFDDFINEINKYKNKQITGNYSIITGESFYDYIVKLIGILDNRSNIKVHKIVNEFFGDSVTVTGLLTYEDIVKQLTNKDINETLLLSSDIFKQNEDLTLDGHSIKDFEDFFRKKVITIPNDSKKLLKILYK